MSLYYIVYQNLLLIIFNMEKIKHKRKENSSEEIERILNPIVKKWFYSKFKSFSLPQKALS